MHDTQPIIIISCILYCTCCIHVFVERNKLYCMYHTACNIICRTQCKVTHSIGCILANTRLHQLHWGARPRAAISCKKDRTCTVRLKLDPIIVGDPARKEGFRVSEVGGGRKSQGIHLAGKCNSLFYTEELTASGLYR